jgi:hypothetical protein
LAQLDDDKVLAIREDYKSLRTCGACTILAAKYGVSRGIIQSVVRNKSWKHLLTEPESPPPSSL